jgi:hypothetical protein
LTLNDAILAATGGPTVNDGLRAYYAATESETLGDAELRWLKAQPGVTATVVNDCWRQFLTGQGFTGTLDDQLYAYWLSKVP